MGKTQIDRSLNDSVKDVAAYGQMVGYGEAYFGAYAVSLGASSPLVGLIATLPPFAGACVQPLAARMVEWTGRRRAFYMIGATLQAFTFLPICASILFGRAAYPVLLACVTLYFMGVHFATPAWNSVMGDLVPPERRGRYFAMRNTVCMGSQWLATILAGVGLEVFRRGGGEPYGFLLIFGAATIARVVSVLYLGRMQAPPYAPAPRTESMLEFLGRAVWKTNFGRFVLFVAAMNFSVAVSGPYFTVYLLRELRFTYVEFMAAQAVVVVAHILFLRAWGRFSDRFGNRVVLAITAVGVAFIPLLWQFAASMAVVCVTQFFAGVMWGGFNLAASNFLFDALPRERRAGGVAQFNFVVGVGVLLGGVFGILIVDHVPARYDFFGLPVEFASNLQAIMLISALLRTGAIAAFFQRFREVRDVPNVAVAELLLRSHVIRSVAEAAGDFLTGYRREKESVEAPAPPEGGEKPAERSVGSRAP